MTDCVGFVLEPKFANNPQYGKCTYFSRIDNVKSADGAASYALTTASGLGGLTMLALVQPLDARAN